jgi:hypothetical protein
MIYRVQHNKDNPYFMLNRTAVEDDRLSFKAVGILTYLLSKPDNWTVQETDLANRHTEGGAAVRTGLAELRECGYLEKIATRDEETGRITGWETHVYEIPHITKTHNVENPHSGQSTNWEIAPIVNNESLVSIEGSEQASVVSESEPTKPPASVDRNATPPPPSTSHAPYPSLREMANQPTAGDWMKRRARSLKYCEDYKPKEHRATFEAIVDAMGKRALVDADNGKTISELQQAAVTLTRAGLTAKSIEDKAPGWKASYFGLRNGSAQQFMEYMATDTPTMAQGKNVVNTNTLLENAYE